MKGTEQTGTVHWVEFDYEADRYRINATFLLSNWHCMFGRGCPGMFSADDEHTVPDQGCCGKGVRLLDEDDLQHVTERVAELTPEDWDADLAEVARKQGWLRTMKPMDELGNMEANTRIVKGSCIFNNRATGSVGKTGKIGCAFHHLAERTGRDHVDTMPKACWQLPLAMHYDGGVTVITAWDADYWTDGPVDNDDWLHWWCVAEGTMVTTEDGPKPIEQVSEEDRVLTRTGFRQVLARWDNGQRPIVKVVHEGGTIFVTEDHELLTTQGWLTGRHIRALTADAMSSVGADVGVASGERVALGANVAPTVAEGLGTQHVFPAGDALQVLDVAAQPVAAQVVQLVALMDGTVDVGPDVDCHVASDAFVASHPVTTSDPLALPRDAIKSVDKIVSNVESPTSVCTIDTPDVLGSGRGRATIDASSFGSHVFSVHHVEDAGVARVYDLTVEGQHEYVANGIVVHNCVDEAAAYSGDKALYITMRRELIELMGEGAYNVMVPLLEQARSVVHQMAGAKRHMLKELVGNRTPKRELHK